VLAAGHVKDRFGVPIRIAGFTADASILSKAFEHIFTHTPLLPPTLAGPRNELLALVVRGRNGVPVYSSGGAAGSIASDASLDDPFGDLRYEIALKPASEDRLVIGGLPSSRLPLLVGLLILTAGLLAVALQQIRREHDLARLRADFVASVSHELRTPLAQIRLFSETLLLGRVRSEIEGRRSLEIIQQESRRLSHLVENVLYFARAGRGAERLAPQPTRLSVFAAEVIEAFTPLARSGRATVRLEIAADVIVPADAGALRQILLNLLDNAVSYGRPDQTVVVGVDDRDGDAILTVDDEGPGVPADARSRIWQPYSRLSSAAASAIAGTGIGLAVVRELVGLHGGRTRVEDAPGGARFVVVLPGASRADTGDDATRESRVPA
jgi:signal transduction histidine kinase